MNLNRGLGQSLQSKTSNSGFIESNGRLMEHSPLSSARSEILKVRENLSYTFKRRLNREAQDMADWFQNKRFSMTYLEESKARF